MVGSTLSFRSALVYTVLTWRTENLMPPCAPLLEGLLGVHKHVHMLLCTFCPGLFLWFLPFIEVSRQLQSSNITVFHEILFTISGQYSAKWIDTQTVPIRRI